MALKNTTVGLLIHNFLMNLENYLLTMNLENVPTKKVSITYDYLREPFCIQKSNQIKLILTLLLIGQQTIYSITTIWDNLNPQEYLVNKL